MDRDFLIRIIIIKLSVKEVKLENTKKAHWSKTALVAVSFILIVVAVVSLLLFLMHGETTVTGAYEGTEVQENLVCESKITAYPLFSYDHSSSKTLSVNAIFKAHKLTSISLLYKLNYNSQEEIEKSEAVNHGALNLLSQGEGLGPDAFAAKYSKLKDGMQLSLYASGSDINEKALKYFMLSDLTTPYTQEKVAKVYAGQGLNCEIKK